MDWKQTFADDLAAEQLHQNLVDGKLTKEEQEAYDNVKNAFSEDMSKYLK